MVDQDNRLKISDFFYGSKLSDEERAHIIQMIKRRALGVTQDSDWERAQRLIDQTCYAVAKDTVSSHVVVHPEDGLEVVE